jgi:hypothetical protein
MTQFDVLQLWDDTASSARNGYVLGKRSAKRDRTPQHHTAKLCSLSRVSQFTETYAAAPESVRILSLQLLALAWALEAESPGVIERWAQAASDQAMHAKVLDLFGERLSPTVRSDLLNAERATRGQVRALREIAAPSWGDFTSPGALVGRDAVRAAWLRQVAPVAE